MEATCLHFVRLSSDIDRQARDSANVCLDLGGSLDQVPTGLSL